MHPVYFPSPRLLWTFHTRGILLILLLFFQDRMNGAKNILTNVVHELQATHEMISRAQDATKSIETATQTVIDNVEIEAKQCVMGAKDHIEMHKTVVEGAAKQCLESVRDKAEKIMHTVQTESKVLNGMYSLASILCGSDS